MKKISLIKLFLIFLKIGTVLFGGGYAILPFLQTEIVEKEKICTPEELLDYYALSQCIPGIVAGNVSMFIGYKARSILGAIICILGVSLPAFISILLFVTLLTNVSHLPIVKNIFDVLDIAVCILIVLTILELWNKSLSDVFTALIFICAGATTLFLNASPFAVVLISGIAGLAYKLIKDKRNAA